MLRFVPAAALWFAASVLVAAESGPLYTLIAPATAAPGSTIEVQIAVMNRSDRDITPTLPENVSVQFGELGRGRSRTLEAHTREPAAKTSIAPGRFGLQSYTVLVPNDAPHGTATLDVAVPGAATLRTTLDLAAAPASARGIVASPTQRPTTNLGRAQPAGAALQRVFANRIGAHEPIYFVYGPDAPAAKFQFSFKYKLLDFSGLAPQRRTRTLQFGFTQRSLWDIDAVSSPFYDTSYMPEIMYESLAPEPERSGPLVTWQGFQAAYKHESNGRDGPMSRSLDLAYARAVFSFGRADGWHLLAIPEVLTYLSVDSGTKDIEDYRGYGKLHLVFGRPDGPSLMAAAWAGKDFDRRSFQFDLTIPVRTKLLNFETYLLVQYFNGYGESLLAYREKTETVRAGVSLVR